MHKLYKTGILIIAIMAKNCLLQGQNFELKDLNVPNAPAFTILDVSPKVIDKPGTAKTFTASIVNLINQGDGIPKNFALEVAPYWLFPNKLNVYSYLGIDSSTRKQTNIFSSIRNTSVSLGSMYKDSTKKIPFNANYIAFGVRVNLIRVIRREVAAPIITTVNDIAGQLTALNSTTLTTCLNLVTDATNNSELLKCQAKELENAAKKDNKISYLEKRLENLLAIKPTFQADVAFANSLTLKDNSFADHHHHRTGVWATLEYNLPLTKTGDIEKMIENKNYLSIYGKIRFINEDSTTNYKTFTEHQLLDVGGRLEFKLDRFSISFESLHRTNRTNKSLNTNRNVGILEYKIRDDLYLSGSFGKNFGSVNNIVALFGLNWGFGKQSLIEK